MVLFSWLFFGFLILGAFLWNLDLVIIVPWPLGEVLIYEEEPVLRFSRIFLSNLFFSSLLLTVSGSLFFVLPLCFLLLRALLLGVLFFRLSLSSFLFALPALILEAEGMFWRLLLAWA